MILPRFCLEKLLLAAVLLPASRECQAEPVRFATFNVSLYGNKAGEVQQRLSGPGDRQAAATGRDHPAGASRRALVERG